MIITSRQPEAVELESDTVPCLGDTLLIGERPIAGASYFWQDGSTKSTLKVTKPGKYSLRVRKWNSDQEVMYYAQFKDCAPFVPNIITPNQDKLNDSFVLKNVNFTDFELQVFNRWGNLIYKTESYQNDWEAKGNTAGLYYYLLRNSETGKTYKGWLEVLK
jgi:gliding motility-associated-like protein